ncbi:site-2 protease family protein [Kangiella sediminilitoris]|uniref:Peptidase M50 n=1 Tax=Kangiella sediminilitoris TaxID=1144748 RepID=A0A1B3BAE4_9GAMM|nr:site-2 protease family protein [Kangiella sediminilitoris]AOE49777.1 Peptidase M50 [Kangiella sediminilitoris]
MLPLLTNGHYAIFAIVLFVIIFSLTLHEFGHAYSAKLLGDDTAAKMGRLNLNPINHIDPVGLLAVILIGFGYAKPVPVTHRKLKTTWGSAAVAAAGPLMNFLIALIAVNLQAAAWYLDITSLQSQVAQTSLSFLAMINILLMLFNLLPIGPLDGHYVMEWLLPRKYKYQYTQFNAKYGTMFFLALIALSILGVPIFSFLWKAAQTMSGWINFFV